MISKITFAAALLIACTNAIHLSQSEAVAGPKVTSKAATVPVTDAASDTKKTSTEAVKVANDSVSDQVVKAQDDLALETAPAKEVATEPAKEVVDPEIKIIGTASDSVKPESATVLMTQFGLVATVLMSITMF